MFWKQEKKVLICQGEVLAGLCANKLALISHENQLVAWSLRTSPERFHMDPLHPRIACQR